MLRSVETFFLVLSSEPVVESCLFGGLRSAALLALLPIDINPFQATAYVKNHSF
jgi:hypothetical protein